MTVRHVKVRTRAGYVVSVTVGEETVSKLEEKYGQQNVYTYGQLNDAIKALQPTTK